MCECGRGCYALDLEDRIEDLAYEKKQLADENKNLKLIMNSMADEFLNYGFCFAQKFESECKSVQNKNKCIECTINYFKNKIKDNND